MKRLLLIITMLACILPSAAFAFFGSKNTSLSLSKIAEDIAKEIKEKCVGGKLYIKSDHVTDAVSGGTLPLSGLLSGELERYLSKAGFSFEAFLSERVDFEILVTFHRSGESLQVNVQLLDIKKNGSYRTLEKNYSIAIKSLPDGWDQESLDDRIARLVQRTLGDSKGQVVYINPIVEKRKKYSSEFGEYVQNRLKSILSTSGVKMVEPLSSRKQDSMATKTVALTLETSDAARIGANTLLDGGFLKQGDKGIFLALTLKDLNGKVLSSADDTIPRALVTYRLENEDADRISEIADVEHEQAGNMVRIGTTKGGGYQVYYEGDVVIFTIQVSKPLYVYVYNINPKGSVTLLYPKVGDAESRKQAGLLYRLPDENDSWEIKVESPYGKDVVKVFASDRRLPMPTINDSVVSHSFEGTSRALLRVDRIQNQLSTEKIINGLDIVDYFKGVTASIGAPLYESSVFVETRSK